MRALLVVPQPKAIEGELLTASWRLRAIAPRFNVLCMRSCAPFC